jgi:hypothetical protein
VDHYDAGHCVNTGQGGMFVLAAKTPPVGIEVEVEFVIPAFGWVPRPTRLHCVGRVSRVETCCQLTGFAVAGHFVNELQAMPSTCVSADERAMRSVSETLLESVSAHGTERAKLCSRFGTKTISTG